MPKSKEGLGRGFESLIPTELLDESFDVTASQDDKISDLRLIKISEIHPDPNQPRQHFDEEGLDELAGSIREHGIIQPLVVAPDAKKSGYVIVAGERRWYGQRKKETSDFRGAVKPVFAWRPSKRMAFIDVTPCTPHFSPLGPLPSSVPRPCKPPPSQQFRPFSVTSRARAGPFDPLSRSIAYAPYAFLADSAPAALSSSYNLSDIASACHSTAFPCNEAAKRSGLFSERSVFRICPSVPSRRRPWSRSANEPKTITSTQAHC